MKAPRPSEVTARVVAWHNRHPLARRIDPTQVHSIGTVRLPFASAQPWTSGPAAPAAAQPAAPAPAQADSGAAPQVALHGDVPGAPAADVRQPGPATPASGIDGLEVQSLLPEDAAAADGPAPAPPGTDAPGIDLALDAGTPSPAGDDEDDGEAALVIPLLDGEDAAVGGDHPADAGATADGATLTDAIPSDPSDPSDPSAAAAAAADLADADAAAAAAAGPSTEETATDPQAADPDAPTADAASPAAPDAPLAGPPDSAPPEDIAAAMAAAAAAPAVYPPPHGNVPASALARAVERRAAARQAAAAGLDDAAPLVDTPPPPGRRRGLGAALRAALARLRLAVTGRQPGLPPLRAAFSQDFIWPLRPARVARWARRHGQPQPVAPADWPQRVVDTDRARLAALRQKGQAHDVPLHVLTAAIGVGDRRMRVLVGADGSVLGPRAYDRARVGALSMLVAVGLVGTGWALRPLHGQAEDNAALLAAAAASAPAPASTASAASAPAAQASGPEDAASATALADAASAAHGAASGADHAQAAAEPASAPADSHAAAPDDAASQAQASIRPVLSDAEKYAAKVESAKLRGEPPPPPPPEALAGPVYAVVGPATAQRDAAAGSLALMRAAAAKLASPVPEHGELVQSQGQWRAAWWPFASLVDAERARVLLAGRGLKAEVVEF